MPKVCIALVSLLCLALVTAAQAQLLPRDAGLRYGEQVSNGPAGSCGCFTLQGGAADASWNLGYLSSTLH
jgi:hypothetical protein